jgi:hypothetical protein
MKAFQRERLFNFYSLLMIYSFFLILHCVIKILFWPFVTSKNERQIAVHELSQPFASVRHRSPMIKNLKITLIFEKNKDIFPKKLHTQVLCKKNFIFKIKISDDF